MRNAPKNTSGKPVTETELTKILEYYPTKDDLTEALKPYSTKEQVDRVEKSLKESITDFKDAILHEIKGLREEVLLVTGYKQQIEDHETDIAKLKKIVFPD